ncbi:uncharacterized protein TM35_000372010 [Trypanosoma theileri]|uniref:Uncharacterized protein n=1 Tax=Trypanosoma theileri TaxID=67003 RepID=A0A1X0NL24_9TRYP|nr:uncharacterized protein TM35_000372010 [Trypanosoma theileri]ORC85228.1 hypothetical protein TM35_000372010 [Trypanosoma theileri]
MSLNAFVRILSLMYSTQDNDARRAFTVEVLKTEEKMSSDELLRVGVDLLRASNESAAVQAYGAVLLRRAVKSGRVSPNAVPYNDIMVWYFNEPTMGGVLHGGLIDLITECMVFEWPEGCPDLMERLCSPKGQLAHEPRKLNLLCSLTTKFMEPHIGHVPVSRMRILKEAMASYAKGILIEVIQALFDMYTAAGGENSQRCVEGTESLVTDCLTIIANLAPSLSIPEWWEIGLGNALSVLVHWRPVAHEALSTTTSLLRVDSLSARAKDPELSSFMTAVLRSVEVGIAECNYSMLEETMELLLEMPDPILSAVESSVCLACHFTLVVPSIYLAFTSCMVLRRLGDVVFNYINPLEFIMRLATLVEKNKFDPETGSHEEGRILSEQQYGTHVLFNAAFAEFRGIVGQLLSSVARLYPVVSNRFIYRMISTLCDGAGTREDPRTTAGFVTHQSPTYLEWEAAHFMLTHLSESFKYSSDYVPEAIGALLAKQNEDMVLSPLFLNMLSSFWNCRDDAAFNVWEGTLEIIFISIERKGHNLHDPDVSSARKRALTLLINACSQHSTRLAPLCDPFLKRMECLLMSVSTAQHEKSLLYEAMAALTCALPPAEAQYRLQTFLNPIVEMLVERVQTMDQRRFNDIITARTSEFLGHRDTIRNSVCVIAGVLRRCTISPYLVELSTALVPFITQLVNLIHGIRAEELPPAYVGILEMGGEDREQYLPGKSRKSNISGGPVYKARNVLMDLRLSLYQVIGVLSSFIPADRLGGLIQTLGPSAAFLPIHAVRSLITRCLFPVGGAHPILIPGILHTCAIFFARYSRLASPRPEDEIIDSKQLFFFSKDIFTFIRTHIVERKLLIDNIIMSQAVSEVALTILESGTNINDSYRLITTVCIATKHTDKEIQTKVDELAVFVFGRVMEFTVQADSTVLPFRERDRLLFLLADAYVENFPKYTDALRVRFPHTQVEELHAHLTVSSRMDVKRRRFKEFLLRVAGGKGPECV